MDNARKTTLNVIYNGKVLSSTTKHRIENFKYTDVASGESDSIEMTLNNRDFRFMKNMPRKGDKISCSITRHNWVRNGAKKTLKCGGFTLDDLSFSAPPLICSIGAVSLPAKGEFKSRKRKKTYKNITVREIASTISKRAGIPLYYSAPRIRLEKVEQNKVPDSEFLLEICSEYGLGIKIYNGKIVIFDEEKYEKKVVKTTIHRNNKIVESWDWNTTLQGTYTGAKVSYTDPDDNKTHHVTIGKKGRLLEVDVSAFSKNDAILKAKAKLAEENKKRTTMTLTIFPPDKPIVATDTIRIKGFYKLSGKYYVDKVEHSVSSSGYTQTLTAHKVSTRIS